MAPVTAKEALSCSDEPEGEGLRAGRYNQPASVTHRVGSGREGHRVSPPTRHSPGRRTARTARRGRRKVPGAEVVSAPCGMPPAQCPGPLGSLGAFRRVCSPMQGPHSGLKTSGAAKQGDSLKNSCHVSL